MLPALQKSVTAPSRIGERFAALRAENKAALVTFITAGDPDYETSLSLLKALPGAGADIVELGMAFSDPMADGPAIEAAGLRALKAGISVKKTLEMVSAFRQDNQTTPIVLMGYFNPIYRYGIELFVKDAIEAGMDGLIIVDLPPEEDDELRKPAEAAGLNLIRLVTPTTDAARLPKVLEGAGGFIYYVAVAGVTGTKSAGAGSITAAVERIRAASNLPISVGFGIKTPEQAGTIAQIADGAVVGSAIVEQIAAFINETGHAKPGLIDNVLTFVSALKAGMEQGRQ